MATVTARGIVWTTTTGAKTVASFTPGAGDLIVCVAGVAGVDTAPTISDNDSGITSWTLVDSFRSYGSAVLGGLRIYVAGQACSGSPMTVTMTPGGVDTGGGLAVFSVTSPSGYGSSGVRSTGGQADIASGTPAPVLSNTPLSTNPVLIAVMTNTNGTANASPRTATTPDYTEAYDQGFNTPPSGLEVQFINSSETSATLTTGGAAPSGFASIGVEFATVAATNWSQPEDEAPTITDAQAKSVTSPNAESIAGVDVQAKAVTSPQADAATVTDAIDPQLTEAPFSPSDIAGLYAWYDADQLGLANNDPVASWTDESGGGRHAVHATTPPTFKTGVQNGLPGVLFDGTDDKLAATFAADTSRTIFVVARATSLAATGTLISFASTSARLIAAITTGDYRWNQDQASSPVLLGGTATNTTVVSLVVNSATSMDAYLGSGSASNFDPNNLVTTNTTFNIGHTSNSVYWIGYVFEIVVYDSALTAGTDRQDVIDHLTDKWIGAAVGHTQPVNDAITGTDSTTRAWVAARLQPDAIAGTDAQAKASTHPLADTAAATDARASSVGHALADPIAGTDAATRRVGSARADTIAGTDTRASVSAKPLADTATVTDARARVWAAKLTIADGISATDNVSTSAAGANERNIDDSLAATDALARTIQARRTVSDSAAGTDAKSASVGHPVADAIVGIDARARVWAAKLTITDGISVTDNANIGAAGAREQDVDDLATVTDAISVGHRRTLGDSFTVTDASATQADYVRQPADALAAADVLARAWVIFEEQADALTITDAVNARIPPARWPADTDEDWPAGTDEDWEAQTDDRWLVSAESRW